MQFTHELAKALSEFDEASENYRACVRDYVKPITPRDHRDEFNARYLLAAENVEHLIRAIVLDTMNEVRRLSRNTTIINNGAIK